MKLRFTVHSEAIIDVNHEDRWNRCIELVGGVDFNLEKAVEPFAPETPLSRQSSDVSYDGEVDAAFFYFKMKEQNGGKALTYSHSLTTDAEFAFDECNGLLWIRFSSLEANSNAVDFVSLIDTAVTASD